MNVDDPQIWARYAEEDYRLTASFEEAREALEIAKTVRKFARKWLRLDP